MSIPNIGDVNRASELLKGISDDLEATILFLTNTADNLAELMPPPENLWQLVLGGETHFELGRTGLKMFHSFY